jgi:hypothetical protein
MKTEQRIYSVETGWNILTDNKLSQTSQIVFLFGDRELLKSEKLISEIKAFYPKADVVGCSTSGEICQDEVKNGTIVSTAIHFDKTCVSVSSETIGDASDSFALGQKLAENLSKADLKHVFVLSEGLNINGSQLTKGINDILGASISVTGGLAGDQALFQETAVVCNAAGKKDIVVAVGFYGESIKVGYGSKGGWSSFGVDRMVTKSVANVLYELDGKPALSIYKTYLGEHAAQLPSSALLFPISFRSGEESIVRTILSVNEADGSMVFAGDIPQGEYVRLMSSSNDKLFGGAIDAAEMALESLQASAPDLAFLISCVGRKLVLKNRVEEELEGVMETLGGDVTMTGFYSYGEICPTKPFDQKCELHNQTMTVTVFKEI